MEKICLVYITASDKKEASRIGEELVSQRLAACANIYDNITSFYQWEGKQQKDTEAVIMAKTKESLLPELEAEVKKIHSYSCPCIIAVPILYASREYAEWVNMETR